jgi:hypothetical protein
MSLTDLKKGKNHKVKKKYVTVDEFISDAEDYANGTPKIVSELIQDDANHKLTLQKAISDAKHYVELAEIEHQQTNLVNVGVRSKRDKPFRRATFTLSEEAIAQLHLISEGTDLAKSHILRILIDELCKKEQNEQLKKLLASKVD